MRAKAQALAKGEDPDGDAALLDVLGTLHKFAGLRLSPEAFVEALDPLQPRLYSISSSPRHEPGRLTLTVDRCATGSASGCARRGLDLPGRRRPARRAAQGLRPEGAWLRAAGGPRQARHHGRPGTGIAPFRAFLQERIATGATGKNWLFFGHQRMASDFFYADELNAMKEAGHLQRMTLAWSRDGAEKIYVQDRMRENGAELWAWLRDGAHFYVCGDAKRMAKDVERALVDVAQLHGGLAPRTR